MGRKVVVTHNSKNYLPLAGYMVGYGLDVGVIFPLGLMCLLSTTWKLHLGQKLWPFQGGFHDGIAFPVLEWACVKNRKRVPKAN